MKKLIALTTLLSMPAAATMFVLLAGCPAPQYPAIPQWVDNDKIIGNYLGDVNGIVPFTIDKTLTACDEQGDQIQWTVDCSELAYNQTGTGQQIQIQTTIDQAGIYYFYVICSDGRTINGEANGTVAVYSKENTPPIIYPTE